MVKRKAQIKTSIKNKVSKIDEDNEKSTDKNDVLDEDWSRGEDYLVYNPGEVEASSKIAAFDIDGTIIITKTGKKFPKTWDDFKIMLEEIPGKLKSLKAEGYKLVIFTNQGGFVNGYTNEKDFKKKMLSLLEQLGVKMQIFIATGKSTFYRKPNIGLFQMMTEKYNSDIKVDFSDSFYVGDAAGRPDGWAPKRKKDFSCSDRLFALNCGLKFYTPEEYFLNEKPAPYNLPEFNPMEAIKDKKAMTIKYDNLQKITSSLSDVLPADNSEQALIIMVGSPGSGKSHFCKRYLEPLGYNIINRDTLKTSQKCVAETERLLKEKKKVVIDNTNPDKVSREKYVSCALNTGVLNVLCFILDVTYDHSRHNSKFRELIDSEHDTISEMIFRMHNSKYKEPELSEKFTSICKISPALLFDDDGKREMYGKFLNDK